MIFFAWVSGVIFLHMFFLEDIEEKHGFFGVMYPILRRLYLEGWPIILHHHNANLEMHRCLLETLGQHQRYFWCPGNLDGSRFKNENQDSSKKKVEI